MGSWTYPCNSQGQHLAAVRHHLKCAADVIAGTTQSRTREPRPNKMKDYVLIVECIAYNTQGTCPTSKPGRLKQRVPRGWTRSNNDQRTASPPIAHLVGLWTLLLGPVFQLQLLAVALDHVPQRRQSLVAQLHVIWCANLRAAPAGWGSTVLVCLTVWQRVKTCIQSETRLLGKEKTILAWMCLGCC